MDSYNNLKARAECNLFAQFVGVRLTKIEQDYVEGELTIRKEHLNPMGIVHGGCLSTLADTVTGCAVATRGNLCVTLDCRMDYLHPVKDTNVVRCAAKPQRIGRTIAVYRAELTNEEGKMVALGTFTFYIKDKPMPDYVLQTAEMRAMEQLKAQNQE